MPGGAGGAPRIVVDELASAPAPRMQPRPRPSRPTRARAEQGRTKHDEKITVYISADELLALETARLTLRGQHGVAADRGRIVREAIAVMLADLEERGEDSVLVRRLAQVSGLRPLIIGVRSVDTPCSARRRADARDHPRLGGAPRLRA